MKKKLIALLCVGLLFTGCGKVPKLENGQESIISYKDGTLISVDDYYNMLKDEYGLSALINMIDKRIYEIEYKDKIEDAKKDAKEKLEKTKEDFVDENGKYDEDQLLYVLDNQLGISSIEAYEEYLYLNYFRELAIADYSESLVKDKEIEKYYKSNIVGDIKVSHILLGVDVKKSASSEEKKEAEDKALEKAKKIIKELDKAEDIQKTFEKLAKENSTDQANSDKGGDLGFFNKGEMIEEFEKAAYALKKGAYTKEPVKTKHGYHIILKTDEKEKKSLEDAKAEIVKALGKIKTEEDSTIQITALTKMREDKYGVKINDSSLNDKYNKLMSYNLRYARELNAQK